MSTAAPKIPNKGIVCLDLLCRKFLWVSYMSETSYEHPSRGSRVTERGGHFACFAVLVFWQFQLRSILRSMKICIIAFVYKL